MKYENRIEQNNYNALVGPCGMEKASQVVESFTRNGFIVLPVEQDTMVQQAIVTKWIAPTNMRGGRVKATAAAGSLVVGWDHALNPEENHRVAAKALQAKLDWPGVMAQGCLPDGSYAFVILFRA